MDRSTPEQKRRVDRRGFVFSALLCVALAASRPLAAQDAAPPPAAAPQSAQPAAPQAQPAAAAPPTAASGAITSLATRVPREKFADLVVANRYILTFRAAVVPRDPTERADASARTLAQFIEQRLAGPVASRDFNGVSLITVGGRDAFAVFPSDVDVEAGEDLQSLTAGVVQRLGVAMQEGVEAHTPVRLAWAFGRSLAATVLLALFGFVLLRVHRSIADRLLARAQDRLKHSRVATGAAMHAESLRSTRILQAARNVTGVIAAIIALAAVYPWAVYVLQQFPLTRPWGEHLGRTLIDAAASLALRTVSALPGLFTVVIILAITQLVTRLVGLLFDAIQQGHVVIQGLSGAKVVPTRRLVITLIWLFAMVVAYPYMPGSETDAFKGISIFLGLVVSLGSSGIVNQAMSGFLITYSDSLTPGDFVRIGEVEGTVTSVGILSTKIKTRLREEITIPNAVLISGNIINYTRYTNEGIFVPTSVTIGYNAPWRQVEALLLRAASQTKGIKTTPAPFVMQTSLSDFYVEYTLLVSPERPDMRVPVLAELRSHIQDQFNEFGVQIMSPHYESDPSDVKVVPRNDWFAAPAKTPGDAAPAARDRAHEVT
ncbi:MAG TPA: mechanosensitive ion channel family protein [Vicinamibacterales bacterium]|nr:mechanosensitive ion channel family protein [Vicinamibacterales bacterium]